MNRNERKMYILPAEFKMKEKASGILAVGKNNYVRYNIYID